MNKFTNYFRKAGFLTLFAAMFSSTSKAAIYTAVLSGNFNASTTWGGSVPGTLLSSDDIIIPTGVTVILTADQTFTGTSSLTVDGTLTSSASALIMTGGSLEGTGTITVDSIALGLISGITYTGNITVQKFTSLGAAISTTATVVVGNSLNLLSGVLSLTSGSLTMSNGSTIQVAVGGITVGGTGMLNLTNTYNVSYSGSSVNAGAELSGAGLSNVTVNIPGSISLSSNLNVNGILMLTSGTLTLNNHNLTFGTNGDLAVSGTGNIDATSASNITINATNGLSGNLNFASGGSTVNNFTVNMGNVSSMAKLGSNLTVNGLLRLQSGKLNIGSNNLMLAAGGLVSGGTSNSYVVTNGIGSLVMNLVASTTDTFQVGTALHYAPMAITANSSSASGDVSISVIDSVYLNGTSGTVLSATQRLVSATWFVSSTATAAINYNMLAMWNAAMEVNGFDRTQSYISHFTSSAWDVMAFASATTATNGMYAMARTGITSLSPFTVADKNADLTSVSTVSAANGGVTIYPNPATGILYFNTSAKVSNVNIYDVTGRLVKSAAISNNNSISVQDISAGFYNVYFSGNGVQSFQKFIKQ